jgi:hypothetical protein
MSHTDGQGSEYIAFVDDPTQELENHEHAVRGDSEEEACLNAQAEYPHGMIRAVVFRRDLAAADAARRRVEKRRTEEREELKSAWPADLPKPLRKWPGEE